MASIVPLPNASVTAIPSTAAGFATPFEIFALAQTNGSTAPVAAALAIVTGAARPWVVHMSCSTSPRVAPTGPVEREMQSSGNPLSTASSRRNST